jgi:uncharacterized protein
MARRIESVFVDGPVGRLEALLEEPEAQDPQEIALVCHPHPQHGGTMHNKVVYRLARGLRTSGAAVLRFNYRGVNLSEGEYDHGVGEVEDARSALAWLRGRYPSLPFTLAGFSFGSRIALRLGCLEPGARRLIAVGFPTRDYDATALFGCPATRIFIQSKHDQYGPLEELEPIVAGIGAKLIPVEANNHFFQGGLDAFEEAVGQAFSLSGTG